MPSSRRLATFVVVVGLAISTSRARADTQPQGFAVERLYRSAAGGGWLVMDALDVRGGLGGAVSLSLGYASRPLVVTDGARRLAVVSDQAFFAVGASIAYQRWRVYLDLDSPLVIGGESGTVGSYTFGAPAVTIASNPDTVMDVRLGFDARLVGAAGGRFRLGAGVQLLIPNGDRPDYDTDGTFRGMVRLLGAGDVGRFTYAGHLGVHLRPLDDAPSPGSPRGSELLVGVAAGTRFPVGASGSWSIVVGPELFGAAPLRSFLAAGTTALEALLSGRVEGPAARGVGMRVKLGAGAGLAQFGGAPAWRLVASVEMFHRE